MIFLIEALVLCILFTVIIMMTMKKPRVVESIKRKWPAIIVFGLVIGLLVYFINDADSFLKAFCISYGLWTIVDWYDALVLDIGWFCHSKKVRIPGTEDMVKDYQDYWFHIKASLVGMLLGLPTCLVSGVVCQVLP